MALQINLWDWSQRGCPGTFFNDALVVKQISRTVYEVVIYRPGYQEPMVTTRANIWEIARLFRCKAVDINGWFEYRYEERPAPAPEPEAKLETIESTDVADEVQPERKAG